ncbi:MAG: ornithine carbamoyltransferase, partial [Bosea sp.]|nr:ornithine carbamoyltransferase [Bosea sp. (in: a-proteobacteria)]
MGTPVRHFLDLSDFSSEQLQAILRAGNEIKARRRTPAAAGDRLLEGKVIAMIFEQPSLRTRVSFDVGIRELGGSPMMGTGQE